MILEDIETKLSELGLPVFYGKQRIGASEPWNYIVFARSSNARSASKHAKTKHVTVAVIHENYVDDDYDDVVAEKLCSLPGVRIGDANVTYDYTTKPGTDIVVEAMVMDFAVCDKR